MEATPVNLSMIQKALLGFFATAIGAIVLMSMDSRSQITELRGDNRLLRVEILHLRELIEDQRGDQFCGRDFQREILSRDAKIKTLEDAVERTKMVLRDHERSPHPDDR